MTLQRLATAAAVVLSAATALATGIESVPNAVGNFNNVVFNGQTMEGSDNLSLRVVATCYATNLRSVANPLSPNASVRMKFSIKNSSGNYEIHDVVFPGRIVSDKPESYETRKNICVPLLRDLCNYVYQSTTTTVPPDAPNGQDVAGCHAKVTDGDESNDVDLLEVSGYNDALKTKIEALKGAEPYTSLEAQMTQNRCFDGTTMSTDPAMAVTSSLPDAKAHAVDNIVRVESSFKVATIAMDSQGNVTSPDERDTLIKDINFIQEGIPPQMQYMGQPGPLSASVRSRRVSNDRAMFEVHVAFPGQSTGVWGTKGFCGGWFSPLMMFFDDKRPTFKGIANFKLRHDSPTGIRWPEAGAPGFFLAHDKSGKKQVKDGSNLFGDTEKYKNGFESLGALDSNKDGKIDAKDKQWKNLFLWQDKNSNAKVDPGETFSLKEKNVEAISLKANHDNERSYGERAKEVGESTFTAKDGKELKTLKIIDVWFGPSSAE